MTEADQPDAPGVHEGQHQTFPRLPLQKPLRLNEAAVKGQVPRPCPAGGNISQWQVEERP